MHGAGGAYTYDLVDRLTSCGSGQTLATYAYANDNPLNATDPAGLCNCDNNDGGGGTNWGPMLAVGISITIGVAGAACAEGIVLAAVCGAGARAAAVTALGWPGLSTATRATAAGGNSGHCQFQFGSPTLLADHHKHIVECGNGNITEAAYLKRAQDLLSRPVGGEIHEFVRPIGVVLRYNDRTNEFAVRTSNGTIRTLFRPAIPAAGTSGHDYWLLQIGAHPAPPPAIQL